MIPDEVIDEIRTRADIVAVIGQHVQLRKAGRSYKGLCPFHGEKTPSFNVSPDKGFFYCFGCQKKGDVFTFVMEYEGKSFHEAVTQLAARAGVALPEVEESPGARAARSERARMLELNKLASGFFREVLAHPERGRPGRDYLASRGVDAEITERFQLGYAPADWHLLADFLKAERADLELAVKAGLIAHQPRAGGFYDRYRSRLVCPVVVPGGEIAGFSARIVGDERGKDGTPVAKYINSPESAVYKKSKLLFGLAQARESFARKKRAVLVEGNFDVITLHQAGFTEVVAPLGTALTAEQVELLRRLADEVVLCYDGDRAGRTATLSSLELLIAADVPTRIASIPDGQDPDSLVRAGKGDVLDGLLRGAVDWTQHYTIELLDRAKGSPAAQARAMLEVGRLLSKVANPVKHDLITGTLAAAMDLEVGTFRRALARAHQGERPRSAPAMHPNDPRARDGSDAEAPAPQAAPPERPLPTDELELIALLADHPTLAPTADSLGVFSLLTDGRLRDMYSAARTGRSLMELAPVTLPATSAQLVLSAKYAATVDPSRQLQLMVEGLRQKYASRLPELHAQLAEAKRRGDHETARRLASEIVSTRKQVD